MTVIHENRPDEARDKRSSWSWQDALQPIPWVFDWYKKHAGVGALILAAFLVAKCYVIARGNLTTALGILQYAGLTSVVIAGLLSSLPILTALMLGWVIFRMAKGWFPGFRPESRKALACVLVGTLALSVFFTPWPYMLAAIILGLLAGFVEGWRRWAWLVWTVRVLVGAVAVAATIMMLYSVWVPHEIVVLRPSAPATGRTPNERGSVELGYVMADDPGGWITILRSGTRTIVRFRDDTVRSITVCEQAPHGGITNIFYAVPFWDRILHPGSYIPCSDTELERLGSAVGVRG